MARDVVVSMYDAINRRKVDEAMQFVDPDIVYEDLNFPSPFKGDAAVRELFSTSCNSIPADLQFVIDECTAGDPLSVGMYAALRPCRRRSLGSRGQRLKLPSTMARTQDVALGT